MRVSDFQVESANSTIKNPQNIYKNSNSAEHVSGHGFEPSAYLSASARLDGFAGKTFAADPEHGNTSQKSAKRYDID